MLGLPSKEVDMWEINILVTLQGGCDQEKGRVASSVNPLRKQSSQTYRKVLTFPMIRQWLARKDVVVLGGRTCPSVGT